MGCIGHLSWRWIYPRMLCTISDTCTIRLRFRRLRRIALMSRLRRSRFILVFSPCTGHTPPQRIHVHGRTIRARKRFSLFFPAGRDVSASAALVNLKLKVTHSLALCALVLTNPASPPSSSSPPPSPVPPFRFRRLPFRIVASSPEFAKSNPPSPSSCAVVALRF